MTSKVETTTATSTRTSSRKFFRRTVFRRAFAPKAAYMEIVDETPTALHKKPPSFPKSLACFRRKPASCEASLIAESDTDEDSKAPRKAYVDRITVESPRVQPPLKPCLKSPTLERPISLEMDDGTLSGNSIMVDEDAVSAVSSIAPLERWGACIRADRVIIGLGGTKILLRSDRSVSTRDELDECAGLTSEVFRSCGKEFIRVERQATSSHPTQHLRNNLLECSSIVANIVQEAGLEAALHPDEEFSVLSMDTRPTADDESLFDQSSFMMKMSPAVQTSLDVPGILHPEIYCGAWKSEEMAGNIRSCLIYLYSVLESI